MLKTRHSNSRPRLNKIFIKFQVYAIKLSIRDVYLPTREVHIKFPRTSHWIVSKERIFFKILLDSKDYVGFEGGAQRMIRIIEVICEKMM